MAGHRIKHLIEMEVLFKKIQQFALPLRPVRPNELSEVQVSVTDNYVD